jgi:BirA family biotin operon repressor/biotin-[acetyl-CoA-carboxylase] ligase
MSEPLPDDVARALHAAAARLRGYGIARFAAEVDSTNDIAIALAERGAAEGAAVLADAQRAGRGRRGRDWYSPPGAGIYLSVVVRPSAAAPLSLVTLAAGVAAARAVRGATGLAVELKWPNDLVVGRPWRKLGGILCEAVGGSTITAVVVGMGINLRHLAFPPELAGRATSIEGELGRPADRGHLVAELLAELAAVLETLRRGGGARQLRDEWRRLGRNGLGGAPIRWHDQQGERRGVARDIDADGALVVDVGGREDRLVAGEVTWERLSRD